ncbi:MAG: tRNA (adenosine(37)-N6)-dimethylallyltransferase MiaA [Proteobacteria bacterium]|nr:tRNA (adenosine(37)-N6)-dimethylallyltransferase MiaA [Pseudomonadota bacterium]
MLEETKPKIICLMGPTACGKTDLAISLAKALPIEIINVDSAQIYLQMDIGTGKPHVSQREQIPHHLMDFLDPGIAYSAAQFRQDVLKCIQEIQARKKIPLLVGGSMLYFKILQEGISKLPQRDPSVRAKMEEVAKEKGWAYLHQVLVNHDPEIAAKIKPSDPQRIGRALEIIELTGMPVSYWLNQPKESNAFEYINIGLLPQCTPRSILHQRIQERFDAMLTAGLVDEVKSLMARGDLDLSMPSMRAVGYRQVWQFLNNELSFEMMREKAISATRQLAKRQLTWLRRWSNLLSYDFLDPQLLENVTKIIAKV